MYVVTPATLSTPELTAAPHLNPPPSDIIKIVTPPTLHPHVQSMSQLCRIKNKKCLSRRRSVNNPERVTTYTAKSECLHIQPTPPPDTYNRKLMQSLHPVQYPLTTHMFITTHYAVSTTSWPPSGLVDPTEMFEIVMNVPARSTPAGASPPARSAGIYEPYTTYYASQLLTRALQGFSHHQAHLKVHVVDRFCLSLLCKRYHSRGLKAYTTLD